MRVCLWMFACRVTTLDVQHEEAKLSEIRQAKHVIGDEFNQESIYKTSKTTEMEKDVSVGELMASGWPASPSSL